MTADPTQLAALLWTLAGLTLLFCASIVDRVGRQEERGQS